MVLAPFAVVCFPSFARWDAAMTGPGSRGINGRGPIFKTLKMGRFPVYAAKAPRNCHSFPSNGRMAGNSEQKGWQALGGSQAKKAEGRQVTGRAGRALALILFELLRRARGPAGCLLTAGAKRRPKFILRTLWKTAPVETSGLIVPWAFR